ncbi:MAG: hypothetical protein KA170_12160, partial [Candidatus Promineofilum sp.]|nr:hypothetical protein [Promineifilum sp.]
MPFVVQRFSALFSSFVVERFSAVFLHQVAKNRAKALHYEPLTRVIVVLIVTLSLLAACRPSEDTWAQIEASGVLRIGV